MKNKALLFLGNLILLTYAALTLLFIYKVWLSDLNYIISAYVTLCLFMPFGLLRHYNKLGFDADLHNGKDYKMKEPKSNA